MSHILRIEFPDDLFFRVKRAAELGRTTPEEWVIARAKEGSVSEQDLHDARQRLLDFAGCFDSGDTNSADNERIDADLAAEYGSDHEGKQS